ncbi:MAG: Bcr/CflA family multidrug efflux MFS transporter [Alphaproteobacteria bacterium]|nr:Bcr/CflA family multidrug efflux MFS transporter [Alphaproteobacteria bacterium]
MAFAPMAIDMYLPALPKIEQHFGSDETSVQLTLAVFFLGFALGQAFYGPFADRFGRKPPLYFGLILFIAASIACAFAPSVEVLIALRFVQALGACANGVIARAMVRDLYEPREAVRIFSLLTLVFGAAPVLAPLIGGYILLWHGWREIFIALSVFGFVSLVAVIWRLPESRPKDAVRSLRLGSVLLTYGELLTHRDYMGCVLVGGFSLGGLFAYISGSPFVIIELYGVAPEDYGWLFGANALGLVLAAQVNARLVHHFRPQAILLWGIIVQAVAGGLLVIQGATGAAGLYGVAVPLFIYVSCIGLTMANATALAMAPFAAFAGAASALLGTIQFGLAAIMSTLVGTIHDDSSLPMAIVIAGCSAISLSFYRGLVARRRTATAPGG